MTIKISNVPLYWRFEEKPKRIQGIPERYDFIFDYDHELDLYIEPRSSDLLEILEKIYLEEANIGYMIDGNNLGNSYGSDYSKYIEKFINFSKNKTIVDVGCGGCKLLENFSLKGINVMGVDPSPVALNAGKEKNINIKNEFLNENTLEPDSVNYITQMDVMEHVFDPVKILIDERKAIKNDGIIFINVPNCESSIELGDISMLIHQHVNMYTRKSLTKVVEKAGLYVYDMSLSNYGSAIYCAITKNPLLKKYSSDDFNNYHLAWDQFEEKALNRIAKFQDFFCKINDEDNGYFIFQRIIPYLCAGGFELNGRYFDNNTLWFRKYLDGIPKTIENENDFLNNPTQNLFIFSHSFGDELVKKLSSINSKTNYYTQKEVFNV